MPCAVCGVRCAVWHGVWHGVWHRGPHAKLAFGVTRDFRPRSTVSATHLSNLATFPPITGAVANEEDPLGRVICEVVPQRARPVRGAPIGDDRWRGWRREEAAAVEECAVDESEHGVDDKVQRAVADHVPVVRDAEPEPPLVAIKHQCHPHLVCADLLPHERHVLTCGGGRERERVVRGW